MKIRLDHKFEDLIGMPNLLLAWGEFVRGKRSKKDVQKFYMHLMDNILALQYDLLNNAYKHGGYEEFYISDPKPRVINKASVRDRLLHHAVYRILYPFFDTKFISDSFSCRDEKGTHKAIKRLNAFYSQVSRNKTRTCWILKCDIKKFFHSINQQILLNILQEHIPDQDIINLLREIIISFYHKHEGLGLPLGNLTSQLFSNVYMNEFDQFVKHKLKIKHYIRYADDFVILSEDKNYLKKIIPVIGDFLQNNLSLTLHPDKIYIKTLYSGVDFLGWVNFPNHRTIRNKTKNRMLARIKENKEYQTPCRSSSLSRLRLSEPNDLKTHQSLNDLRRSRKNTSRCTFSLTILCNKNSKTLSSYIGLLKHGNTQKLKDKVLKLYASGNWEL